MPTQVFATRTVQLRNVAKVVGSTLSEASSSGEKIAVCIVLCLLS